MTTSIIIDYISKSDRNMALQLAFFRLIFVYYLERCDFVRHGGYMQDLQKKDDQLFATHFIPRFIKAFICDF